MSRRHTLFGLSLLVASGAALAHPGHGASSLVSGFAHPLLGPDHLLTMLAVGVYAAQQKGAGRWALPLTFVLAMLGGTALGAWGMALPAVEQGVAVSLLVLGVLLALAVRLPLGVAAPLVACFAVFHGHAHFMEMGHQSVVGYVLGFVLATVGLHLAGYQLARWLPEGRLGRQLKMLLGGALAATGWVLAGA